MRTQSQFCFHARLLTPESISFFKTQSAIRSTEIPPVRADCASFTRFTMCVLSLVCDHQRVNANVSHRNSPQHLFTQKLMARIVIAFTHRPTTLFIIYFHCKNFRKKLQTSLGVTFPGSTGAELRCFCAIRHKKLFLQQLSRFKLRSQQNVSFSFRNQLQVAKFSFKVG